MWKSLKALKKSVEGNLDKTKGFPEGSPGGIFKEFSEEYLNYFFRKPLVNIAKNIH